MGFSAGPGGGGYDMMNGWSDTPWGLTGLRTLRWEEAIPGAALRVLIRKGFCSSLMGVVGQHKQASTGSRACGSCVRSELAQRQAWAGMISDMLERSNMVDLLGNDN